jgi:caffeoyl-CoA O-methyltransferase
MRKPILTAIIGFILSAIGCSVNPPESQNSDKFHALDRQVQQFIESRRGTWRDYNVPDIDGKALYDIISQHGYKNALEIGTSSGYSGLWISWALAKTGGNLVTIEIDKDLHDEAVANFRAAGLAHYIDARLGDAHDIVPALKGPFDFVFCDADKEWYVNYLKAALSKIPTGGCFAAHNVTENSKQWSGRNGNGVLLHGGWGKNGDYLPFALSIPSLITEVLNPNGSDGLAVSYKK